MRSSPSTAAEAVAGKRALTLVSGRVLYQDRVFDLSGYTGATRRLPLRFVQVEVVRSSDDSLLATGYADAEGSFGLAFELTASLDVQCRARTVAQPGLGESVEVFDSVGPGGDLSSASPWSVVVADVAALGPGATLDLGEQLLADVSGQDPVQAFNVLDCMLDAVDLFATATSAAIPGANDLPPAVWSTSTIISTTEYVDGVMRVGSPAGGDTDGWSDALILAALGHWFVTEFGAVQETGSFNWNLERDDPRVAFGDASGLVFAGLVRQSRAGRLDADGGAADANVAQIVDLGFPPPPGFPGSFQDAFDLEGRALALGDSIGVEGQLGMANVASMLWDLCDDNATPDGRGGDDDGLFQPQGGADRFLTIHLEDLPVLGLSQSITYEDFDAAWGARFDDAVERAAVALDQGHTSIYIDSFEADDDFATAGVVEPWVQPAPTATDQVVIGELHLGARDWVELTNIGDQPLDIGDWSVTVRRNGFSQGASRDTTVPAGTMLGPGRSVLLHEGGDMSDNGAYDLYDPGWSIPWRERQDGAATLFDDLDTPRDFVRWNGDDGASSTPTPPGLSFTGSLAAPPLGWGLSRDDAANDTDNAGDWAVRLATPRVPNSDFLVDHSVRPVGDRDLLRMDVAPGTLVLVNADRPRDDAWPVLAQEDSLGGVLAEVGRINSNESAAVLQLAALNSELIVRLSQDPAAHTGASFGYGAWIPFDQGSTLSVVDFRAEAQLEDPDNDRVELSWMNRGQYDGLDLYVDQVLHASLPGNQQVETLFLTAGTHELELIPMTGGQMGDPAATYVFVGSTPCFITAGFEFGDPSVFQLEGMGTHAFAASGTQSLRCTQLFNQEYPPNDVSSATLSTPLDLTAESQLRFTHAAHLADDADVARVEIRVESTESWDTLATYRGADHDGTDGDPANWLDGTPTSEDWVDESIDLAAYAGQRVRVRFIRVSDATDESFGWTIDDVFLGSDPIGERWITTGGDDGFGCGHHLRPFSSYGVAVASAAPGDTVRLGGGIYTFSETLNIGGVDYQVSMPLYPGLTVRGSATGGSRVHAPAGGIGAYGGPETGLASGAVILLKDLAMFDGAYGIWLNDTSAAIDRVGFWRNQTGLRVEGGAPLVTRSTFARGTMAVDLEAGELDVQTSTITHMWEGITARPMATQLTLGSSILSHMAGPFLTVESGTTTVLDLTCNNFYSSNQPFVGLEDPRGQDFNQGLVVEYCNAPKSNFLLPAGSPLLTFPGCGRIGALGQGCSIAVSAPSRPVHTTRLLPNVPNPFNPSTQVRFELGSRSHVRLEIFDARGRRVRRLVDGFLPEGTHAVPWNGRDASGRTVATGIYHLRLTAEGSTQARPIVLLK